MCSTPNLNAIRLTSDIKVVIVVLVSSSDDEVGLGRVHSGPDGPRPHPEEAQRSLVGAQPTPMLAALLEEREPIGGGASQQPQDLGRRRPLRDQQRLVLGPGGDGAVVHLEEAAVARPEREARRGCAVEAARLARHERRGPRVVVQRQDGAGLRRDHHLQGEGKEIRVPVTYPALGEERRHHLAGARLVRHRQGLVFDVRPQTPGVHLDCR